MRYEAKFTPTAEDVLVGYRMLKRQPNDFLKLCAFGSVVAFIIFGIAACILHAWILAIGGIWMGAGIFGIPWLIEWRIRRSAEKDKLAEVKVYFTDQGIEVSNNIVQKTHSWPEIRNVMLDERGIIFSVDLDDRSGFFSVFIPARAFTGGYFPLKELKLLKEKNCNRAKR